MHTKILSKEKIRRPVSSDHIHKGKPSDILHWSKGSRETDCGKVAGWGVRPHPGSKEWHHR